MQKFVEEIKKTEFASKAPESVLWWPVKDTVFSFNEMGRAELRKNPALKDFHRFIVTETENGRLFRQEKVSMIPVMLLDPQPDERILDMCAAPGSKTIQILEGLHKNGFDKVKNKGFVIANDTDAKRAYMLTHQAKRLNLPSLFVTCNDARKFPNLKEDENMFKFKYDRILCDVPCSGDGTLRKNTGLWKNFHAHMGHNLHELQLDILLRGLSQVKKGGRLVYSTCSFNPLENEAVVQAALVKLKNKVRLVDVSDQVSPFLRYRPGLTKWSVFHKKKGSHHPAAWYKTYDSVPEQRRDAMKKTMFNETYTDHNNCNKEQ